MSAKCYRFSPTFDQKLLLDKQRKQFVSYTTWYYRELHKNSVWLCKTCKSSRRKLYNNQINQNWYLAGRYLSSPWSVKRVKQLKFELIYLNGECKKNNEKKYCEKTVIEKF